MKEPASLTWTPGAWNFCSGMGEKFPLTAPGLRIDHMEVVMVNFAVWCFGHGAVDLIRVHDCREDILLTAHDLHSSFVGILIELLGELVATVIVKIGRVDICVISSQSCSQSSLSSRLIYFAVCLTIPSNPYFDKFSPAIVAPMATPPLEQEL